MFQYIIEMYNIEEKLVQVKGIVIGADFIEAVQHLMETYDKDMESIKLLVPVGDGDCYELSDEGMKEIDKVRENWIW